MNVVLPAASVRLLLMVSTPIPAAGIPGANPPPEFTATAAPEIVGDPGLQPGECTLETELGSTHLSLDTQLKEIEQGFMDLLEQRPRVR